MWKEIIRYILAEFRNIYLERFKAKKKSKIETQYSEGEAGTTT
jgi:hypothetical protein